MLRISGGGLAQAYTTSSTGAVLLSAIIGAYAGYFFLLVIVAIGLDIAVGKYAESRGKPFKRYFWLAFFLSPLVSFIVLLLESNPSAEAESSFDSKSLTKCPYCAEQIKLEARICKHCGSDVSEHVAQILEKRDAEAAADLQRAAVVARLAREEEERVAREIEEAAIAQKAARKAFWKSGKGKFSAAALIVLLVLSAVGIGWAVQTSMTRSAAAAKAKEAQIALEASRQLKMQMTATSIIQSAKSSLAACVKKHGSVRRGSIYTDFESQDHYQKEINGVLGTRVWLHFEFDSETADASSPEFAVMKCAADLITGVKDSVIPSDTYDGASNVVGDWTVFACAGRDCYPTVELEKFIEP